MESDARFGPKADVRPVSDHVRFYDGYFADPDACLAIRLQSVLGTRREWPGEIAGLAADTEKPGEVLEKLLAGAF